MAQSVQQVFPQVPFEIILSDLQRTQSIDATIENIIDRSYSYSNYHNNNINNMKYQDQKNLLYINIIIMKLDEPIDTVIYCKFRTIGIFFIYYLHF